MSTNKEAFLTNPIITPKNYSSEEKYRDHIFEQYKLYVETAERVVERRTLANTYFLTINTLIVGIAGFSFDTLLGLANKWILIFPLLSVLMLCFVWFRLLRSYRQLSTAKYKVIGEFEKLLPTGPFVAAEWRELGFGKDKKVYWPLTDMETTIPIIFGILYIIGVVIICAAGQHLGASDNPAQMLPPNP